MARFILELRLDDISDPAPVVQDWILDTDVTDSTADFKVPFGYPKTGTVGAAGDLLAEINRAVGMFTDPCNALVPGSQSICTRQTGHVGDHRCSLADVQARAVR